jgi:acyl-coenzyme A synthetase/AMP-(fatty) acid ligase
LIQEKITFYVSTPTVFRYFAETLTDQETFPELRLIFVAGEPVLQRDVALFQKHFATDCIFVNTIGATETPNFGWYCMDKHSRLSGAQVPAGYPLTEDPAVLLLNDDGHDVGINQTGEIVVQSSYLAHGYWRRPDLTQTRFVTDPTGGKVPLYYTGDLGHRLPDGCLLFLGRKDFQVKMRGYRIDVAEIERTLLALDIVQEAVVVVREDRPDAPQVVAYLVPLTWPAPTVTRLRHMLSQTLPDYMIPSEYVILKSLPVNPNGKVERHALPTPERSRPMLDVPCVAPRTPVEAELVRLWGEVLDLEQVGIHDAFLDVGGHSLLAMQLLSRVIQTFRIDLPLRTLLETPTVAEMAVVITQHQAEQADPATVTRLLAEVEALTADEGVQKLECQAQPETLATLETEIPQTNLARRFPTAAVLSAMPAPREHAHETSHRPSP